LLEIDNTFPSKSIIARPAVIPGSIPTINGFIVSPKVFMIGIDINIFLSRHFGKWIYHVISPLISA
jgi:hypothetical protein